MLQAEICSVLTGDVYLTYCDICFHSRFIYWKSKHNNISSEKTSRATRAICETKPNYHVLQHIIYIYQHLHLIYIYTQPLTPN